MANPKITTPHPCDPIHATEAAPATPSQEYGKPGGDRDARTGGCRDAEIEERGVQGHGNAKNQDMLMFWREGTPWGGSFCNGMQIPMKGIREGSVDPPAEESPGATPQ